MAQFEFGSPTETCLLCIPVRPGVLALLIIALILNLISLVTLYITLGQLIAYASQHPGNGNGNPYANSIATVAVAAVIYTCMALFIVWGLWAAYKKRASHFKVFTIIYGILTLISLIMLSWNHSVSSIVASVIPFTGCLSATATERSLAVRADSSLVCRLFEFSAMKPRWVSKEMFMTLHR